MALAVAAISLAALVGFQVELYRSGALASQRTDALAVAADRIESLRTALRAGAAPESGAESVQTAPDGEPLPSGTVYESEWSLTSADGVMMVDVTVRWEDAGGRTHVVALSTAAEPHAALASGAAAIKPEFIGLP